MDFHGINASVSAGIYSMVPLTPATLCELSNQRKQQRHRCLRQLYRMERKAVKISALQEPRKRATIKAKKRRNTEVSKMLTQEDLQAIQTMLEKTITPITERLNRIEGRLENVEERLEKVEENTEITREATNYLLDLVEGKENAIKKLM